MEIFKFRFILGVKECNMQRKSVKKITYLTQSNILNLKQKDKIQFKRSVHKIL